MKELEYIDEGIFDEHKQLIIDEVIKNKDFSWDFVQ